MRVFYCMPSHVGWSSVTRMAHLLARCFDTDLEILDGDARYSRRLQATRRLPRRRGREACFIVAPLPEHLNAVLRREQWLRGFSHVSAWVVDSFRDERIPDVARALGHFDQLFVGDAEMVDIWRKVTRTPTCWVPFGCDALAAGWESERPIDLQRVGRQPTEWQDDSATAQECRRLGVIFAGSATFHPDHLRNNASIESAMRSAKYTLSFSNTSAPADYTHPTVEYLTARWLDAMANGAVVAGITPRCRSSEDLLWEGSVLELGGVSKANDLGRIKEAVLEWSPGRARHNHVQSLRRTDWRWRFREITDILGYSPHGLATELQLLQDRIKVYDADRHDP